MISAQRDINAGFDPSGLTSVTAAQFLQMIQQAAPLSNIGFVIVGAGASLNPAIAQGAGSPSVANNPRFANYIWLNTFDPTTAPTPYYYDDNLNLWRSTNVPAGSIVDASISPTAEIQVSKLQDGNANEIIATAGDGVTVQWSSVNALLSALADSVPLTAIDDSAASSGSFLRSVAGAVTWSSLANVIAAIQGGLTPVAPASIITPGANNTFLGTDGTGNVTFASFNTIASNLDVGLAKLAQGGANADDILTWNGSSWIARTPAQGISSTATISTTGIQATVNLSSATLVENIAHGFGAKPRNVRVVILCTGNDAATGYVVGDELDINGWTEFTGAEEPLIGVKVDNTNIRIIRRANGGAVRVLPNAGGASTVPTSLANFVPKVYAWL